MEGPIHQQYGNYRLGRLLGRGASSSVYLGEHLLLGNQVALKLLHIPLTQVSRDHFLEEARRLSQLSHPQIVRLLDFGVEKETPYLVMEYAAGGTLRTRHRAGIQVPLPTVVFYVHQVAQALHTLHSQHIIHRDIKPENLLLSAQGSVLLSDFGISQLMRGSLDYLSPQALAGSLAYLSPEQFRGKQSLASDQYALAITAYELLTGRRPFEGSAAELCYQHLQLPPPSMREAVPDLPDLVERILATALAKEPDQRFADVRTFASALAHALADHRQEAYALFPVSPPLEDPPKKRFSSRPSALTRMIGREHELSALCAIIVQPEVRLLTLLGTGGVGKTRLAIELVSQLERSFADGTVFVELARIRDPDLVLPSVAGAIGKEEQIAGSPLQQLIDALAERHLLLFLDNFEHVLPACLQLPDLLSSCPGLTILVTSQAALHIQGEKQWRLSPLPLPARQEGTISRLTQSPAIALFVERAKDIFPSFDLTEHNASAIAGICRTLDGLPLAIELAAPRIQLLPPAALLARLAQRLPILTGGRRDLPERQRTLRKTIEWSYDLLTGDEQRLFRRLSIFIDGCFLFAIEGLSQKLGEDVGAVLDNLAELLDKSLIRRMEPALDVGEEPRFTMLETIREFGRERLTENQELDTVSRAHTCFYESWMCKVNEEQDGTSRQVGYRRLQVDFANLRAALSWSEKHEPAIGIRMLHNSGSFWSPYGHGYEFGRWLSRVVQHREDLSLPLLACALSELASTTMEAGEMKQAEELAQEALVLYTQADDHKGRCDVLYTLGVAAMNRGEFARSQSYFEDYFRLAHTYADWSYENAGLGRLADLARLQGDSHTARSYIQQAITLCRQYEHTTGLVLHLGRLVTVGLDLGAYDEAEVALDEATRLAEPVGMEEDIILNHDVRAELVVARTGDLSQARTLLHTFYDYCHKHGYHSYTLQATTLLLRLALLLGNLTEASRWGEEGKLLVPNVGARRFKIPAQLALAHLRLREGRREEARELLTTLALETSGFSVSTCLDGFATLAACEGDLTRAARIFGAAVAMRKASGCVLWPTEQLLFDQERESVRTQLSQEQWTSAFEEGKRFQPLTLSAVLSAWGEASPRREEAPKPVGKRGAGLPSDALSLGITRRELDVLHLLAEGLSNRKIAERLVLSVVTVNSYLRNLYSKLAVKSRTAAVRKAQDHHLI